MQAHLCVSICNGTEYEYIYTQTDTDSLSESLQPANLLTQKAGTLHTHVSNLQYYVFGCCGNPSGFLGGGLLCPQWFFSYIYIYPVYIHPPRFDSVFTAGGEVRAIWGLKGELEDSLLKPEPIFRAVWVEGTYASTVFDQVSVHS